MQYSLKEITLYFLKLGALGFGGPVALVGYMHRDLVEGRKWITEEEYKEGLALAQLAPGPLAAQLGIYIGYVNYGLIGAILTGLAFVIPSFVMVVLLGIVYKLYSGIPWIQSIFYGVGAAVIGIVCISAYKLTVKSISGFDIAAIRSKWLLWLLYIVGLAVTIITEREDVLRFIAAGLLYMVIKAPPAWIKRQKSIAPFLLVGIAFWQYEETTLVDIALFFSKAGAFVFGSGLAIVPFLHGGVVKEFGWLTEQQFLDAVAVAMVTPGPVVITVGFIGYLVAGFPGASIAALATFLPCFLFTVILAPYFKKIVKNNSVKAFVDGITAAVIGALTGAVFIIGKRTLTDVYSIGIAIITILVLWRFKKIPEPYIIIAAALIGAVFKTYVIH